MQYLADGDALFRIFDRIDRRATYAALADATDRLAANPPHGQLGKNQVHGLCGGAPAGDGHWASLMYLEDFQIAILELGSVGNPEPSCQVSSRRRRGEECALLVAMTARVVI